MSLSVNVTPPSRGPVPLTHLLLELRDQPLSLLIAHYPSILRAKVVAKFLAGGKILWVDDHLGNNVNEMRELEQFFSGPAF